MVICIPLVAADEQVINLIIGTILKTFVIGSPVFTTPPELRQKMLM